MPAPSSADAAGGTHLIADNRKARPGGRRAWRRALAGLGGVVLAQAVLGVPVDELAHHYGFDPHVGLLRGWALVLPAATAWWLFVLPASRAPATASPPAGAVPQAG